MFLQFYVDYTMSGKSVKSRRVRASVRTSAWQYLANVVKFLTPPERLGVSHMEEPMSMYLNQPESFESAPSQPEQRSRIWVIVGIIAGVLLIFLACCCCLVVTLLATNWHQISQWLMGG